MWPSDKLPLPKGTATYLTGNLSEQTNLKGSETSRKFEGIKNFDIEDGKMAKFMIVIAYGKGVIGCHQYSDYINSEKFMAALTIIITTTLILYGGKNEELLAELRARVLGANVTLEKG